MGIYSLTLKAEKINFPFLKIVENMYFPTINFPFLVFITNHSQFLCPHFLSSHPPNQKLAGFKTYVHRDLNICSTESLLKTELDYIKSVSTDQCFLNKIID